MKHIVHEIAPIYNADSRILILGTMPSPASREQGFYYGHPQNRFWQVISAALSMPLPATIDQKKQLLLQHRIALWDVLNSCAIEGASDNSITNPICNDFKPIFETAEIRAVYTTGQPATKLYKRLVGKSSIYLPSTSPANCAFSFDKLLNAYSAILKYIA